VVSALENENPGETKSRIELAGGIPNRMTPLPAMLG
jgi:hypothetical protein